MRAILMFHNCEWRSHKTASTDHNLWWERAEADSNRSPSAYQPNPLLLGQTGSLMGKVWLTSLTLLFSPQYCTTRWLSLWMDLILFMVLVEEGGNWPGDGGGGGVRTFLQFPCLNNALHTRVICPVLTVPHVERCYTNKKVNRAQDYQQH